MVMFDDVVSGACIFVDGVAHNRHTGESVSPLRPESPNAIGDTSSGAEQQDGDRLGDRPLDSFAPALIVVRDVTVWITFARDGGRYG